MSENFYQQLTKPFAGLAPMDGVTDQPFRHIVQKYGQPDLIYTEFTNVEGLCHGATRLLRPLLYDVSQRPIIAQFFGKDPASFRQAAILAAELGFDGIDLNMGCPAKQVANHGSGAALIKAPDLAKEIIKATIAGVADWQNGKTCSDCEDLTAEICQIVKQRRIKLGLKQQAKRESIPVSVKTRTGHNQPVINDWIGLLAQTEIATITLHGRTLKQAYSSQANWDLIAQAAELAHEAGKVFIGNGDVHSRQEARQKAEEYNVDGVLIGRAAQGNPFVFRRPNPQKKLTPKQQAQKLAQVALEHARLFEQTFQDKEKYHFLPMRKHLAWYVAAIPHAKKIRKELVRTNNSQEVEQIFTKWDLLA
ncbi:MAG: tRNA-dihydrouridine synthase [Patescibacteria group bacterium]|nr:tRNA-dihydrouridine synthase [Patescibacteria group bacterium]